MVKTIRLNSIHKFIEVRCAADIVAHEHVIGFTKGLKQRVNTLASRSSVIAGGWFLGVTLPGKIDGDHVELLRKNRHDTAPRIVTLDCRL